MNTQQLKAVRASLNAALELVTEEHGISFTVGSMSYTHDSFTTKLTGIEQVDGVSISPAESDFHKYCQLFGFTADQFGARFTSHGKVYTISGLKVKASKYPILGFDSTTGKTFKFPAEVVLDGLKGMVQS
ncbi:hypothetical protein OAA60_00865 [Porticoccaceae bacterium]|nr:hypothetical protein [Porticoccaceae bacterium]